MEDLIKSAVNTVPGLVVLCWVVKEFLKSQKERDNFIKNLHNEHLAARGESRDAIKENTESNREVTKAISDLHSAMTKQTNPRFHS